MAGAGAVLMSASPHRPAQPVAAIAGGLDEQRGEQVLEFAAGQPDQPMRYRMSGPLGGGEHRQEGERDHGEGGPAVPGAPAADLMLVQAAQALAGMERFLNGPAPPGDLTRTASGTGRGVKQW